MRISVMGGGSWGTALSMLLNDNGHEVTIWCRSEAVASAIMETRENPKLPGVFLKPGIKATADITSIENAEMIVIATSSYAVRETSEKIRQYNKKNALVVSASKGIERGTSLRMSEIIENMTGRPAAVLSGPSHAEEVSRRLPTGCVAASRISQAAEFTQEVFMNDRFRVYTSTDVIGVELGGALKNVTALSCGICDGMGFEDNTKALLMTRGINEISRLGVSLGGERDTFAGLAGIGDLIVTCTSMHSRNRRAGILIGQGMTARQALDQIGAVVEGYYATLSAWELAHKAGIEMPITEQAYAVLYEGKDTKLVVGELMNRGKKYEM